MRTEVNRKNQKEDLYGDVEPEVSYGQILVFTFNKFESIKRSKRP